MSTSAGDEAIKLHCIYVAVGQKALVGGARWSSRLLEDNGAMEYSIVRRRERPPTRRPLQFLAPFAGCTMGEYFRDNGMHALIYLR